MEESKTISNVCMVPGKGSYPLRHCNFSIYINKASINEHTFESLLGIVNKQLNSDIYIAKESDSFFSDILMTYKNIVNDAYLRENVEAKLQCNYLLSDALELVFEEIMSIFIDSPTTVDRLDDIKDVYRRFMQVNMEHEVSFELPHVIISQDLTLTQFISIFEDNIKGVVLADGSRTSHLVEFLIRREIPCYIQVQFEEADFMNACSISLNDESICVNLTKSHLALI